MSTTQLTAVQFTAPVTVKERTHTISGKVLYSESYEAKTSKGVVPGLKLQLDTCPYKLNLLKGSIKGAKATETSMKGADVILTGVMREYQNKQYFQPIECQVIRQSNLAKMAEAGAIVHVESLD